MRKDAFGIWLVLSIISMPRVLALEFSIEQSFGTVGRIIYDLLTREYIVFGIVVIVLIIFFRSIFLGPGIIFRPIYPHPWPRSFIPEPGNPSALMIWPLSFRWP